MASYLCNKLGKHYNYYYKHKPSLCLQHCKYFFLLQIYSPMWYYLKRKIGIPLINQLWWHYMNYFPLFSQLSANVTHDYNIVCYYYYTLLYNFYTYISTYAYIRLCMHDANLSCTCVCMCVYAVYTYCPI